MKAIIPVAGAGTKLRPHTYTQPKALIPLGGKPILSIIVDQLLETGINEFIFIVGYQGDKIQDFIRQKYPNQVAHFVHQTDRQGVGHAIKLTRNIVQNDAVFVVLGDTICESDLKQVMESEYSMLGVKKVDDPREFGVAIIDENGFIEHVIEKPQIPKSNMALVGMYKILESELMFNCLESNVQQGVRTHGEYSLTDALECMIQSGARFKSFKVENWFDCGKKDSLLESNGTMLKKFGSHVVGEENFENTIIIPPVSISKGCDIKNSIIGPNVSIGEHTVINYSIVKNSIVGSFSHLHDIVLDSSLIGSDTGLRGESRTLNIGDNTDIDLG